MKKYIIMMAAVLAMVLCLSACSSGSSASAGSWAQTEKGSKETEKPDAEETEAQTEKAGQTESEKISDTDIETEKPETDEPETDEQQTKFAEKTMYVIREAEVKNGPSGSAETLGTLDVGETVKAFAEENGYIMIDYHEAAAFIDKTALTDDPDEVPGAESESE